MPPREDDDTAWDLPPLPVVDPPTDVPDEDDRDEPNDEDADPEEEPDGPEDTRPPRVAHQGAADSDRSERAGAAVDR